jgi:hypothetical protein
MTVPFEQRLAEHGWIPGRTIAIEYRWATRVSDARIWAGFHYRFSTRVGRDMGRRIGEYVVNNVMQPVAAATR